MLNNINPVKVLLVEDNPGDVRLIQETFKENRFLTELQVIKDGEEALEYLKRKGKYKNKAHPDLILLDLNLPKLDGREVLSEIKSNEELKRIPVIILTSSTNESDIYKSYDLNANCYITKPVDLQNFINVIKSIENFWLTIVKLPG
jgi:two-component system response regulator